MRKYSEFTHYLLSPIQTISNTGDKIAKFFVNLIGSNQIIDLLYHFPARVNNKKYLPTLSEIKDKDNAIIVVKVDSHSPPNNKRQPFRINCSNQSGLLTVTLFKVFPGYVDRHFAIGSKIALSGKVDRFNNELQITHPDYVLPFSQLNKIPKQEVIYPLSYGLNQKMIYSRIVGIFDSLSRYSINSADGDLEKGIAYKEVPEWVDSALIQKNNWPNWKDALFTLHNPDPKEDYFLSEDSWMFFGKANIARRRLAYDELLASQFAAIIARSKVGNNTGRLIAGDNSLRQKLRDILPFSLTSGQEEIITKINDEMASNSKMLRLLQGDVGAGKTIIALFAILAAIESGAQAALIAPIALLANQHFKNLSALTKDLGINIAILTSKNTKKQKQVILSDLKSGKIDLIIGTQALIYEEIIFHDLSLIVIDEQHRFGVLQRLELIKKGNKPDILLMSATPIPRSLMMTLYGDMNISILNQKPKNRKPIDTRVISDQRLDEVVQAAARAIKRGEKIYWICPLIEDKKEEDQVVEMSNVTIRYELFKKQFGDDKVSLLHGKMKDKEKDKVMKNFTDSSSKTQILIATTVIEVGIDVADATIIVIENCEQFGLSQLHQLRGRVGRGDKNSYCILLYGRKLSKVGRQRLEIMRSSNDGFMIAEEDLKMRGGGKILGTKQSGLPEYKIANLIYDGDLLKIAGKNAQWLLNKDPNLKTPEGEAARSLLYLFKYDQCIKLIQGG